MDISRSRCFSLLSHVDHGKSTLADRILELCGAVDARSMREQYLDTMDLERERGITIKAQNVRLHWKDAVLHLIDTPGHVDFGYEVSRSLAACEGAVLLVDASQGIEAQTLANCYAALEADLTIVGALNKIDLPQAEPDRRAAEIERVLGIPASELLRISAKTGEGVPELLDAVVERIPAPTGDPDAPLRALIFDSYYDSYRGVVSSVRVFDGTLATGARLRYVQANATHDAEEVGVRSPAPTPVASLGPGEVGYLIAGIKEVRQARVGETVTTAAHPGAPLPGYRDPKPMVFCGLYPVVGDEYADLREALEKLRLNDSSFTYEPETSGALGFGFRCGFLGLLHMELGSRTARKAWPASPGSRGGSSRLVNSPPTKARLPASAKASLLGEARVDGVHRRSPRGDGGGGDPPGDHGRGRGRRRRGTTGGRPGAADVGVPPGVWTPPRAVAGRAAIPTIGLVDAADAAEVGGVAEGEELAGGAGLPVAVAARGRDHAGHRAGPLAGPEGPQAPSPKAKIPPSEATSQ